jgi:hypothetical protein
MLLARKAQPMMLRHLSITLITVHLAGCSASNTGPERDMSHSTAQTISFCPPGVEKPWGIGEYKAFAAYVASLPDSAMLPRERNADSGKLFERFRSDVRHCVETDHTNGTIYRIRRCLELSDAAGEVMDAYRPRLGAGITYQHEAAGAICVRAEAVGLLSETIRDHWTSPTRNRMEDSKVRRYHTGLRAGIGSTLKLLTIGIRARKTLSDADKLLLAECLRDNGPSLLAVLDEPERRSLLWLIRYMSTSHAIAEVRQICHDLANMEIVAVDPSEGTTE